MTFSPKTIASRSRPDVTEVRCLQCLLSCGHERAVAPIQYTIRGVPQAIDRGLRRKASQRKVSLNQLVLDELAAAVGARKKKADFSDLVGQWTPDPEFDRIIAFQRRIDPDTWKKVSGKKTTGNESRPRHQPFYRSLRDDEPLADLLGECDQSRCSSRRTKRLSIMREFLSSSDARVLLFLTTICGSPLL